MRTLLFLLLGYCVFLFACNDAEKDKQNEKAKIEKKESSKKDEEQLIEGSKKSKAAVLNNIELNEKGGVEIARAFLSQESGLLVSSQNETLAGNPVYLNLTVAEGWMLEDDFVSLGATQTIKTNAGETVLETGDLFKNRPKIDKSSASNIRLKATINQSRNDVKYYLVTFKVWDKNGNGEVGGSYQLYVKPTE